MSDDESLEDTVVVELSELVVVSVSVLAVVLVSCDKINVNKNDVMTKK